MTRKRYVVMLAFAMLVAVSIGGCGSNTNERSSGVTAPAQAVVNLSAKFPGAAGAEKSLIPDGTQAIEVYAQALPYGTGGQVLVATLTPAAPTAAVKMAPGLYSIIANAYSSTDKETRRILAYTSTGGEIVANVPNTVNLTFLNGQWTLANPVVLSDGTQLNDFLIGSEAPYQVAQKAGFDWSKPYGGGGSSIRYRFSNNTGAVATGSMVSQFVGSANSIAIFGSSYNLTQKCSDSYQQPGTCRDAKGDRIVMIEGQPEGGMPPESSGYFYQGDILYGTAFELLPNQGRTRFTQNGAPLDLMSKIPATTSDGRTASGSVVEFVIGDRVKSLKTPTSKTVKAKAKTVAQSANTPYAGLSVTDYSYKVCAPNGGTNTGSWSFEGNKAEQIGNAICYDYGWQMYYQGGTGRNDPGDYSFGLVPADPERLGDYCHLWDYSSQTCLQKQPGTGEVYQPSRFIAKRTATKTAIDYGSFKFNFWIEETVSGTGYVYPFTATGSAKVSPAK